MYVAPSAVDIFSHYPRKQAPLTSNMCHCDIFDRHVLCIFVMIHVLLFHNADNFEFFDTFSNFILRAKKFDLEKYRSRI